MFKYPENLKYTATHEWVAEENDLYVIGLTDYAQDALGDIVFINLPEADQEIAIGESFSDVESVKAVSDVYSPVTGIVREINEELIDAPEKVNEDPYGAWLIKVEASEVSDELLSAEEYAKLAEQEG